MKIHNLEIGKIYNCQICGSEKLLSVINFGNTPPCDSLLSKDQLNQPEISYPLHLVRCKDCDLVQINYVVDPKILFHKTYPYRSGITKSLADNLINGAHNFIDKFNITPKSLIIDIGSNDGTFLKGFKDKNMRVLGIEPTDISKIANKDGIETIQEFFNKKISQEIKEKYGSASIVTAANMFAHVNNLGELINGVENLLEDDGYFITESHYILDILNTLQFDSIYHEHLKYYSLKNLIQLFNYYDFTVIDAEKITNYGGSIRCYAQKGKNRNQSKRLQDLLNEETKKQLFSNNTWEKFSYKVLKQRKIFRNLISKLLEQNKTICGIGSPGRSSTLLNFYGLSPYDIQYIAEQSSCLKLGLFIPGQKIPIVDEKIIFEDPPDYAIMLSWHYADQIINNLRQKGLKTKIIVPLPTIKIIN